MIVPMKKVTVLIYHRVRERFLSSLQALGMLHVEVGQVRLNEEKLKNMQSRIQRCRKFLAGVKTYQAPGSISSALAVGGVGRDGFSLEEAFGVVESAEAVWEEMEKTDIALEKIAAQIRNIAPWGSFDITDLRRLGEAGVRARFFIAPVKKFDSLALDEVTHEEIRRDKVYVYFVVFQKNGRLALDCDEFFYPETDKRHLENSRMTLEASRRDKEEVLRHCAQRSGEVEAYLHFLISRYAFLNVQDHLTSAAEETVYVMHGWIPQEREPELAAFLEKEDVYSFFEAPGPEEQAPVLLKNNRWAKLFEPITKMFDLPLYQELDLTVFLAPFFLLFFGLCLGDAGYGLVIFIAATVARFKLAREKKDLAALAQLLGAATFFCGLIVGTLFGFDLTRFGGLKRLVLLDQDSLFYAALVLGLVQVLFGMSLRAIKHIRQGGVLHGLSSIGWIILVLGLVGVTQWRASLWAVYGGLFLILFFNDMKVNVFLRLGKGLWELYGITGVFGDVLSYIRLFALGISSAILGFVVNDSAAQISQIPYVGFILAAVFFLVFHTLNLALSGLSSFVHPLRLTFVEFYKSAGFEGGGRPFRPFCRSK